jgi:hypothetical protein
LGSYFIIIMSEISINYLVVQCNSILNEMTTREGSLKLKSTGFLGIKKKISILRVVGIELYNIQFKKYMRIFAASIQSFLFRQVSYKLPI